ncbi:hypothetical protein [Gordonia paraffinivorans]|uniref:hypothetical protein n=1 Tax=Gordonia paraffinivorans TaxID=175628 RepID=UPI001C92D1CB|nr:hypothetical protein [Gordonia paraffinivorans]
MDGQTGVIDDAGATDMPPGPAGPHARVFAVIGASSVGFAVAAIALAVLAFGLRVPRGRVSDNVWTGELWAGPTLELGILAGAATLMGAALIASGRLTTAAWVSIAAATGLAYLAFADDRIEVLASAHREQPSRLRGRAREPLP